MKESFNLTRRFSVLALACVAVVAMALGHALSIMVSERLLHRDAVVTMEFVQSIVHVDATAAEFAANQGPVISSALEDTLVHIAKMADVLRANVYSPERRAIWSTDKAVMGRQFGPNEELDKAIRGELVYESGKVSKQEHVSTGTALGAATSGYFIEIYVPVRDTAGKVVGVVEVYKTPAALFEAIEEAQQSVALGAALGGLLLYLALIGIVRSADAVMRDQQRRLVEGERLAIVGEMASAVAHSIRNPLAAIRSSVELALDRDPGRFKEPGEDIMAEVDKVEAWIRELLEFSRPGSVKREVIDVNQVVRGTVASVARESARKEIDVQGAYAEPAPRARGDAALLVQVLQSIIGNALDALPQGGRLEVSTSTEGGRAQIVVRDHGSGIPARELESIFKPFYTTKPRGVGLGLPLARRLVERMDGTLSLASEVGRGTTVRISLPA